MCFSVVLLFAASNVSFSFVLFYKQTCFMFWAARVIMSPARSYHVWPKYALVSFFVWSYSGLLR